MTTKMAPLAKGYTYIIYNNFRGEELALAEQVQNRFVRNPLLSLTFTAQTKGLLNKHSSTSIAQQTVNKLIEKTEKAEQVKSKERVANHGEVFTAEREVNAMLDLVKQETERIDSRFLEPACGDGNFLAEILRRKLAVVEGRYAKNQIEFERYAVIAVSSIYGVDILQDNVEDCRHRLFGIFDEKYTSLYKKNCQDECRRSIQFIFSKNILWGDALSLKTPDEKAEPIVFSEWEAVNGSMIKRREYTLANLLLPRSSGTNDLFSDLGDKAFLPTTVAEHPLTHFLKLGVDDKDELQP